METVKQHKQRTLALLLAAALCAAMLPWAAVPAEAANAVDTAALLSSVPYYGDRSKCKMTAEQAEAFAEILADMNIEGTEGPYMDGTIYNVHATLCDVENNGVPILVAHSNMSTTMGSWAGEHSEILYAWSGGQAKQIGSFRSATYGTATSENYVSFGKNASGGYSWSEWRREMAGAWQYYTITVVQGGVLRSTVYEVVYDFESNTTNLYINGVSQGAVRDDYDIDELLTQNGGPQYDVEDHWIDCSFGLPRTDMIAALRSYAQTLRLQNAGPKEILDILPYTGDLSACRMTAAQAAAFADVIEQKRQTVSSQIPRDALASYFNAALFDAGDGIPALWICGGYAPMYNAFYEDVVNEIWAWDGTQAILDFQNGRYSRLTGRGIVHDGCSLELWIPGIGTDAFGHSFNKALFPLAHGRVSKTPTQVYAELAIYDGPASSAQLASSVQEYDRADYDTWLPGLTYNYTTVKGEYEYDGINDMSYYLYTFDGGTGTDGLNWDNTLLKCERETLSGQWGDGSSVASLLRAYAEVAKTPVYTFPEADESDAHYRDVAQAVSGRGVIQAVYRLLDDLYYVLLENQGAYSGAVVRGVTRNGKPVWEVSQTDEEPAEESALEALLNRLLSSSNLTLDFGKLRGSPTVEDLTSYLRELLQNYDGLSPNDAARTELATFLDSAVPAVASGSVSGRDNRLTLNSFLVSKLADTAKSAWADLTSVLNSAGVALNKTVTPRVRLLWQDVDPAQACQLTVDKSLISGLNGADLQLLLGSGDRYVQFSADSLRRLTDDLETFSVQFSRTGSNTYSINFLDRDGQLLDSLPSPVTLGLPAPSMTSTVMVSYGGGSDNWGGQYDEASGVLAFETRYSGQYEVLENNIQIDDITDLSEESQAAIRFMVSKGYLTLDENGLFNPRLSMTRYDFTRTLVSMFFALDRSLSTTFTDVPKSSEYYDYVASAEANQLVQGVTVTTFGGEESLQVEQMLTIAGRTLAEQKGYALPRDAEQYLSAFEDSGAVSDWARLYTALSVREGLQNRGGTLAPQSEVTREQAALVLYRLFLRLYEVPPVALDLPAQSEADGLRSLFNASTVAAAASAAVLIAAGVGAAVVTSKKRKAAAGK